MSHLVTHFMRNGLMRHSLSLDSIIKVVFLQEQDVTMVNQLQYAGAQLISSKIVPQKPGYHGTSNENGASAEK